MKYYKVYHKQLESGDETMNYLFNLVGDEHPLTQARRRISHHFKGEVPEFKKLDENHWRLNGVHRHPVFGNADGVWHVEYSHDEGV